MNIKKLFSFALPGLALCWATGLKAQAITNVGDTLTIQPGAIFYAGGDMNVTDDGGNYGYIKNSSTLRVDGNFTVTANTKYNGSGKDSLILAGARAQTFPGFSYGSLVARGGNTKSMSGKMFIKNLLWTAKGNIDTQKDTIVLDSLALMNEDAANYTLGNIRYTKYLAQGITYKNANIGIQILANSAAPGFTTIFRKAGPGATQKGFCSSGIARYYEVSPANNYNLGADIVLYYAPNDLNSIMQTDLQVFQSHDHGKTWVAEGYTLLNSSQNSVSINAMDTLDRYTLGSNTTPIINPLKAGDSQVVCNNTSVKLGGGAISGHSYHWATKPAGLTGAGSNPTFWPKKSAMFYLTETAGFGACTNTDSVYVKVIPAPDSTWNVTHASPGYTFKANDTTLAAYAWDLGDGTKGTDFKIFHAYKKELGYKVKLTVTAANGCKAEYDSSANFTTGIAETLSDAPDMKVYPNPFSGKTKLGFTLQKAEEVSVTVMDMTGKEISVIQTGMLQAGPHMFEINIAGGPGIYFVKTTINNETGISRIFNQ